MNISPEQLQNIKEQLIQQIESSFPEDKKNSAKQQIESMNEEQLIEFLKANKLIKTDENGEIIPGEGASSISSENKCIFCEIEKGNIQSYQVDKNKDSVAVLEINPVSKGHIIVIPKIHQFGTANLPKSVFSLAKKISARIKSKFRSKEVKTEPSNMFGHEIINIFPVYSSENLSSARNKAKPEELLELQNLLKKEKKTGTKVLEEKKPIKKKAQKIKKLPEAPVRIP
jgi:diadenosine tetraphosphate (Ap4A) HIT family hydrolase